VSDRVRKVRGRIRHRWVRFQRWLAFVRHVPHSRDVWCGDRFCPYAVEASR
jgi:hypothetical protein